MNERVRIKYTMKSPVSHIGETASTGAYFQTVLTSAGRLPIITGNSVRGKLRDYSAINLLDTVGCKVDKEVFHILFSGGNLNGTMKNDIAKAKAVRETFPNISLFGGGLGDMIMQGKLICGNLYPLCKETEEMLGVKSDGTSWHSLIDEIEFTRTDDSKNDIFEKYIENVDSTTEAKASTQMRFTVQYLAVGTVFIQDIILEECSDLEMGAFIAALDEWFAKNPTLGGMGARGFGFFDAEVAYWESSSECIAECKKLYENHIKDNITEKSFDILISAKKKKEEK